MDNAFIIGRNPVTGEYINHNVMVEDVRYIISAVKAMTADIHQVECPIIIELPGGVKVTVERAT